MNSRLLRTDASVDKVRREETYGPSVGFCRGHGRATLMDADGPPSKRESDSSLKEGEATRNSSCTLGMELGCVATREKACVDEQTLPYNLHRARGPRGAVMPRG